VLYYVRHGETVWNRQHRLQGRLDSPLTLRGVELAIGYGRLLRERIDGADSLAIHSSPMGRARQTAVLIAESIGFDPEQIVVDEALTEHDVGAWGGRTWAEIERDEGIPTARLRDWDSRPPGGETRSEMAERARGWLAERRDAPVCVAVSHGGFSRVLRGMYLGLEAGEAMNDLPMHAHGRLYQLANGRIEEVVTDSAEPTAEQLLG
jgi:probable phosphoglycerate mutase